MQSAIRPSTAKSIHTGPGVASSVKPSARGKGIKTCFTIYSAADQRRSRVHPRTRRLPCGGTASTAKWRSIKPVLVSEHVNLQDARAALRDLENEKHVYIQYPPQMEMVL